MIKLESIQAEKQNRVNDILLYIFSYLLDNDYK